jgi:SAM-dependent methyltransferase
MDVLGMDISSNSIEIAKRFSIEPKLESGFGSLNYICENIITSEFGSKTFDAVVFFLSLHHVPETMSVMKKIYDSLKDGGSVVLVEPIQNKFTRRSAEFAAIVRLLSPTWVPYEEKIRNLDNSDDWNKYVDEIYSEYMYEGEHKQSGLDNVCSSDLEIIGCLKESGFHILETQYESTFIDKLIGGLRGDSKYVLARFLKFLDGEMIKKDALPPTVVRIHAIKK